MKRKTKKKSLWKKKISTIYEFIIQEKKDYERQVVELKDNTKKAINGFKQMKALYDDNNVKMEKYTDVIGKYKKLVESLKEELIMAKRRAKKYKKKYKNLLGDEDDAIEIGEEELRILKKKKKKKKKKKNKIKLITGSKAVKEASKLFNLQNQGDTDKNNYDEKGIGNPISTKSKVSSLLNYGNTIKKHGLVVGE